MRAAAHAHDDASGANGVRWAQVHRPRRRTHSLPRPLRTRLERLPEPVRRILARHPASLLGHPSVRRAARRRLWAVLVAVLVAAVVLSALDRAERGRAAWGRTVDVMVARHDLDAGETIGPGAAALERWPVGLVAEGALHELPSGRRLAAPVRAGELIVDRRLAAADAGPTGAALARDEVVVSLPLGSPPAAPAPGDHVDVYAPQGGAVSLDDPSSGLVPTAAARLATRSRVLAVRPDAVDVAVRRAEAQEVAAAVLGGLVALVVVG